MSYYGSDEAVGKTVGRIKMDKKLRAEIRKLNRRMYVAERGGTKLRREYLNAERENARLHLDALLREHAMSWHDVPGIVAIRGKETKRLDGVNLLALPDGQHPDGEGLYLHVTLGSRRWVYRYKPIKDRPDQKGDRYMGLGPFPKVTLGEA